MEQRGQASAVLVVGGAPKVEECLRRKTKQKTVTLVLAHFEGLGGVAGRFGWPTLAKAIWVSAMMPLCDLEPGLVPLESSLIPCDNEGVGKMPPEDLLLWLT